VTQANKLPEIRKEAFKKARESAGLSTQELALKACLSNRQIEQLENGEMASFYGAQVKYTAAKKVAGLLKLADKDAFDFGSQPPVMEVAAPVEEMPPVEAKKTKTNKAEKNSADTIKAETSTVEAVNVDKPKEESAPAVSKPDLTLELQDVIVEKSVVKQSSSSSSQKKWFLILSLSAAVIFSVVNLRPMFFPEAPKEVVAETPGMPVEAAPANPAPAPEEKSSAPVAASTPVVGAAVASSTDCPAMDSAPVAYRPDAPKKAADMVYMQSKSAQMVCVIDALGKVQNKQLEPGVGVSVYGKAPLKVLTSGLDQVDLYFQGAKVRPASLSGKTIILEAAELAQPLTPTDSQLR
jgi:transcriptional regulator with XRE-family HTH domain